jgi:hypothetical protein
VQRKVCKGGRIVFGYSGVDRREGVLRVPSKLQKRKDEFGLQRGGRSAEGYIYTVHILSWFGRVESAK